MDCNKRQIRCMFAGPSGIGKTTLAKYIAEKLSIPFVSGSYSDLVPSTSLEKHSDMLKKGTSDIYTEDHRLFRARVKKWGSFTHAGMSFVTDRSYIDGVAYFIYKLSKDIPKCEIESLEHHSKMMFTRDCTHLIIMQCTETMVDNWRVEENEKRITNTYFQWMISNIMMAVSRRFGLSQRNVFGHKYYTIAKGTIKVLVLTSRDLDKNKELIDNFLK